LRLRDAFSGKGLEANPEVIILVDRGEGILDQFKSDSFWNKLTATVVLHSQYN